MRERIRVQEGREPTPSAACVDTQSVKTTEVGGEDRGYDGRKKIKGRKQHLLVDTLGVLMMVVVTAANLDDGTAAPTLLNKVNQNDFPRLEVIVGDSKYHNHSLVCVAFGGASDMENRSPVSSSRNQRLQCRCQAMGGGTDQCLERSIAPVQ